jgi:DnaJ-class molecular chaperone
MRHVAQVFRTIGRAIAHKIGGLFGHSEKIERPNASSPAMGSPLRDDLDVAPDFHSHVWIAKTDGAERRCRTCGRSEIRVTCRSCEGEGWDSRCKYDVDANNVYWPRDCPDCSGAGFTWELAEDKKEHSTCPTTEQG